jgi:hypothetical protein
MTETQQCGGSCKRILPLTSFGIARSRLNGRNLYCPPCSREKVYASRTKKKDMDEARKRFLQPTLLPTERKPMMFRRKVLPPPIQMVREAVQNGARSRETIKLVTRLRWDVLTDCLAILFDEGVLTIKSVGEERLFFVRRAA